MSQKFSVQALLVLLSVEALLGSAVSVDVISSEFNILADVGEGPVPPIKGADVVRGANPAPLLDPGEAL